MAAEFALAGWALVDCKCGGYVVGRWGRTRHCQDPDSLAAFLADLKQGGVSEAELETQEKRGMATGLWAIHPLTGADVPVYVANFVLMGYGTGAVMAVPAHDQRDWEFAKAYGLPVTPVIVPPVPMPATTMSTAPSVSFQISSAVVSRWTSGLATFAN